MSSPFTSKTYHNQLTLLISELKSIWWQCFELSFWKQGITQSEPREILDGITSEEAHGVELEEAAESNRLLLRMLRANEAALQEVTTLHVILTTLLFLSNLIF